MRVLIWLILFLLNSLVYADEVSRFIVLDVGEGQSLLVQRGNRAMMIDTGHAGEVASVLKRAKGYGIESIDILLLTHLHPDHASGLFRVNESFNDIKIYHNCQKLPRDVQPDMVRWVSDALHKNKNTACLGAGDAFEFYGIEMSVLWPVKIVNNNLNYNSLVLAISFHGSSILVMGDAGFAAEQYLIDNKLINEKLDLLVVGHHGAKDTSSESFLTKLTPVYSVVSVNENNVRGYPSLEVINRLKQHSKKVFRTNEQGDLVFVVDENRAGLIYQK